MSFAEVAIFWFLLHTAITSDLEIIPRPTYFAHKLMGWGSLTTQRQGAVLGPDENSGHWSEQPGRNLISEEQWLKIAKFLNVSEREREVCELLFEGLTREGIAERLDLKVRTIRHYLERLHTKLGVNNRVALVLRIIQVRDYLKQYADGDPPKN